MRIVTFDDEPTADDLAARLHGKKPKKDQAAFADQLRIANPHLRDLKTIPKGTPVVVPDDDADDPRLSAAAESLRSAIEHVAQMSRAQLDRRRESLQENLQVAKSVRSSIREEDEKTREEVTNIESETKKRVKELDQRSSSLDKQIEALGKALDGIFPKSG